MMHCPTTIQLRAGRLVVVKQRVASQRVATETEARWLAAARHPGVVPLRRVSPATGVLETSHVGLATLRTRPTTPAMAAFILASVGRILADLHGQGLIHGNLAPEHVILTGPHQVIPILCSPRGANHDPRLDVIALSQLAQTLATQHSLARSATAHWRRPHRLWPAVIDEVATTEGLTAQQASRLFDQLGSARWPNRRAGRYRSGRRRGRELRR